MAKGKSVIVGIGAVCMTLASTWTAPAVNAASVTGFTLVQEVEFHGRHIKLWRNNDTNPARLHGEITNAQWPDQIMLTGSGCPFEQQLCHPAHVRQGTTVANTIGVVGVVDACGNVGREIKCTCVVCLHAEDDQSSPAERGKALGQRDSVAVKIA
ncbi:hypothetical protein [Amycolatopsis sp. cmx-11-12]|uniref:hypothetical protein n=1 Tax=Amycolatopsis sp. cmx-11-12 TaxID=2785795 RepID=UPI0039184C87